MHTFCLSFKRLIDVGLRVALGNRAGLISCLVGDVLLLSP